MNKITEFTLDVNKWNCGYPLTNNNPNTRRGEGITKLKNSAGEMCCLGQFAEQSGFSTELNMVVSVYEPADLVQYAEDDQQRAYAKLFTKLDKDDNNAVISNELATELMQINDNKETTIEKKVDQIEKVLAAHGIKLNVIW